MESELVRHEHSELLQRLTDSITVEFLPSAEEMTHVVEGLRREACISALAPRNHPFIHTWLAHHARTHKQALARVDREEQPRMRHASPPSTPPQPRPMYSSPPSRRSRHDRQNEEREEAEDEETSPQLGEADPVPMDPLLDDDDADDASGPVLAPGSVQARADPPRETRRPPPTTTLDVLLASRSSSASSSILRFVPDTAGSPGPVPLACAYLRLVCKRLARQHALACLDLARLAGGSNRHRASGSTFGSAETASPRQERVDAEGSRWDETEQLGQDTTEDAGICLGVVGHLVGNDLEGLLRALSSAHDDGAFALDSTLGPEGEDDEHFDIQRQFPARSLSTVGSPPAPAASLGNDVGLYAHLSTTLDGTLRKLQRRAGIGPVVASALRHAADSLTLLFQQTLLAARPTGVPLPPLLRSTPGSIDTKPDEAEMRDGVEARSGGAGKDGSAGGELAEDSADWSDRTTDADVQALMTGHQRLCACQEAAERLLLALASRSRALCNLLLLQLARALAARVMGGTEGCESAHQGLGRGDADADGCEGRGYGGRGGGAQGHGEHPRTAELDDEDDEDERETRAEVVAVLTDRQHADFDLCHLIEALALTWMTLPDEAPPAAPPSTTVAITTGLEHPSLFRWDTSVHPLDPTPSRAKPPTSTSCSSVPSARSAAALPAGLSSGVPMTSSSPTLWVSDTEWQQVFRSVVDHLATTSASPAPAPSPVSPSASGAASAGGPMVGSHVVQCLWSIAAMLDCIAPPSPALIRRLDLMLATIAAQPVALPAASTSASPTLAPTPAHAEPTAPVHLRTDLSPWPELDLTEADALLAMASKLEDWNDETGRSGALIASATTAVPGVAPSLPGPATGAIGTASAPSRPMSAPRALNLPQRWTIRRKTQQLFPLRHVSLA